MNEITSLVLVKLINDLNEVGGNKIKLQHIDLLNIIRDEFKNEIKEHRINTTEYQDETGELKVMYILTLSQVRKILVRENVFFKKILIDYNEYLEYEDTDDEKDDRKSNSYCYIPRDIFDKKVTVYEIRLLSVLSVVQGTTIRNINSSTKRWVMNSNKYSNNQFKNLELELIEKQLINPDGTGFDFKNIDKLYYKFLLSDVKKCKNLRQLFLYSLKCNFRNKKRILKINTFENIFGDTTRIMNQNWKRALTQLDLSYTWKKENNKIFIE